MQVTYNVLTPNIKHPYKLICLSESMLHLVLKGLRAARRFKRVTAHPGCGPDGIRLVPKYTFHCLTVRCSSWWLANRELIIQHQQLHSKFRHKLSILSGTRAPLVTRSYSLCALDVLYPRQYELAF